MFEFQLKQILLIPISIGLMCFLSSQLFAQNLQLYKVDGTTNDGSYFSLISGDGNTLTGSSGLGVNKPQFTFKINTQTLSYFSGNNTFTLPLAISNNGDLISGRGNFTSANNVPYFFQFDALNNSYSFTQIPISLGLTGAAIGINAIGDNVIGYSKLSSEGAYARKGFLFSNNVLTPLRTDSLYSFPSAISSNGNVVVGATTITSTSTSPTLNQFIAFKYTNGVMQTLPQMASSYGSESTHVSQNGDVIAGIYYTTPSSTNTYRGFVYSGNVIRDIGTLGGVITRVKGISANGEIIVGNSTINASNYHGFKYSGGVMQDLGTLGGLNSTVSAISANGYAIVGESNTSNGTSHGYVFSNNIMRDLGTLGGANSKATGVSDDGRVIVGQSQLANSTNWTTFYAFNPTDIIPNFTNPISDLGLTFYPRFDGGILSIDNSSSTSKNFTITANHGSVDTQGNEVRFSGIISDDSAGIAGSLTILNTGGASSGKVIFSGENTYSGTTTINSGATLVLASSGSISHNSQVINQGTFDLTAKSNNVQLGGSYSQSVSGLLKMNLYPRSQQQLLISGKSKLDGSLYLNASQGTYSPGKYTLISSSSRSGEFSNFSSNLNVYTTLLYDLGYDNSSVYLTIRPNVKDTQTSLQQMVAGLQSVYALQTAAINNGLGYDCTVFDTNGICVSAGGRYTRVNTGDNGSNGLIIGAYRLNPQIRLGGYIDQNLTSSNLATGITLGNVSPLFGVFGVWNEQADQLGSSVRVAAGYGDRDLSMTRQVIGANEAGSGSTRLNSQAVSIEASYAMPIYPQWTATLYLGTRYTKINASAYSEQATAVVGSPLSIDTLSQEYTTALAGLRVNGKVDSNIGLFAGAGIEQDLNNHGDNYSATGLTGLTAINLNPNLQKTRAVVNLGAFFEIDKAQRVSFNAIYRQEAFQSTNTLTSLFTYTAGF